MAIKINGTTVVDNSRNITGVTVTGTTEVSFGGGATPTRPGSPVSGDIRYNTSLGKMEVYTGSVWRFVDNTTLGIAKIHVTAGGLISPSGIYDIEYKNLDSSGNSEYFGDLLTNQYWSSTVTNSNRAIVKSGTGAGSTPGFTFGLVTMETFSILSKGNATLFATSTPFPARYQTNELGNETRGYFAGGQRVTAPSAYLNTIDYVTFGTTGSYSLWGTLGSHGATGQMASTSTPTTGYLIGGNPSAGTVIGQFSLSSAGNETGWGSLSPQSLYAAEAATNGLRMVVAGGYRTPSPNNYTTHISNFTLSNVGSYNYHGELTQARGNLLGTSTPTYGVFLGGRTAPGAAVSTIDRFLIGTLGNASAFGSTYQAKTDQGGGSNVHGGLGISPGITPGSVSTSDIALIAGGTFGPGSVYRNVDYKYLTNTSNSVKHSEMSQQKKGVHMAGNNTRAIISGGTGYYGVINNTIDYVNFGTTGYTNYWGSSAPYPKRYVCDTIGNNTRGYFVGGQRLTAPSAYLNTIDYVTFGTTGSYSLWGTLGAHGATGQMAGYSDSTTAVLIGGNPSAGTVVGQFSLSSAGNETGWGSIAPQSLYAAAGCSSSTRGITAGGYRTPSPNNYINVIYYTTIASPSFNFNNFGTLTTSKGEMSSTSNKTRGVFMGGRTAPGALQTTMEYVTIGTLGNGTSFANLTNVNQEFGLTSNNHGGI